MSPATDRAETGALTPRPLAGLGALLQTAAASRTAHAAAVALLTACFLFLGIQAARRASVTFDEYAHIPAGVAYWGRQAFHLYAQNPPLARLIAAVPILGLAAAPPVSPLARIDPEYRWEYAEDFALAHLGRMPGGEPEGSAYDRLVFLSRLPILVLGAALGGLIFLWSRALFGFGGGLLSLALFAFCPNILAHAGLATTDIAAALFILLAMHALYRFAPQRTCGSAALAAGAFGLALLAKFSALVLLPLVLFLLLLPGKGGEPPVSRGKRLGHLAIFSLTVWAVFCAGYFYTEMFRPLGELPASSRTATAIKSLLPASLPVPLPAAALFGLDAELARADQRLGIFYLRGELSRQGWFSYYPIALGVKASLPLLLLWAAALIQAVRRAAAAVDPPFLLCLLLPPLVMAAFFVLLRNNNYGIRYLLPCFPFLFILSGALWRMASRRWAQVLLFALVAWHAAGSLRASPHFLAHFNELAGGSRGGLRILADSNLDWGQQLKELKAFMTAKGISEIALSYNGPIDPRFYGIRWRPYRHGRSTGWVAVSANHLVGYFPMGGVFGGGVQDLRSLLALVPEEILAGSLYVYRLGGHGMTGAQGSRVQGEYEKGKPGPENRPGVPGFERKSIP